MTIDPLSRSPLEISVSLTDPVSLSPSGGHQIPISLVTELGVVDIDAELTVFIPEAVGLSIFNISPRYAEARQRLGLTGE